MEWINVRDELPETFQRVQVWMPGWKSADVGYFNHGKVFCLQEGIERPHNNITHWAALLDPPIEIVEAECCYNCKSIQLTQFSLPAAFCKIHNEPVAFSECCAVNARFPGTSARPKSNTISISIKATYTTAPSARLPRFSCNTSG